LFYQDNATLKRGPQGVASSALLDFLHLIMLHVLPEGFRRVGDYGFLHGNAKKLLALVQLILHVVIKGLKKNVQGLFINVPVVNHP